jgi:hypothetical protein
MPQPTVVNLIIVFLFVIMFFQVFDTFLLMNQGERQCKNECRNLNLTYKTFDGYCYCGNLSFQVYNFQASVPAQSPAEK